MTILLWLCDSCMSEPNNNTSVNHGNQYRPLKYEDKLIKMKLLLLLSVITIIVKSRDIFSFLRPGRMVNVMTVYVTNKTCSKDSLLESDTTDVDTISSCRSSCLNTKYCSAFSFIIRENSNYYLAVVQYLVKHNETIEYVARIVYRQ